MTCRVSFRDVSGCEHSIEVTAGSLNEAAVLGLKAFRQARWLETPPGPASVLEVAVRAPEVAHRVHVGKLQDWLQRAGKTPKEQAVKARLRELLEADS